MNVLEEKLDDAKWFPPAKGCPFPLTSSTELKKGASAIPQQTRGEFVAVLPFDSALLHHLELVKYPGKARDEIWQIFQFQVWIRKFLVIISG